MRRVLVTGASGFIGRHTLPGLVSRGFEVHALSRTPHAASDGVWWHAADLADAAAMRILIANLRPTHLLHLAWDTEPSSYYTAPRNVSWLRASLDLCETFVQEGGKRMIGAGSAAEYDLYTGRACVEDETMLRPNGLYGHCKKALQEVLAALGPAFAVEVAWGRIFFCYGPGENPNRSIPRILREVHAGRRVPLQPGEGVRDYLHVRDVADAFVALTDSTFVGSVNIGSGEGITLRSLLTRFATAAGHPEALDFGALPAPAYEPPYVVADTRRLQDQVGWRHKITLDQGIEGTAMSWRNAGQGRA